MHIPEKYRERFDNLARTHPWMREMADELRAAELPEGDAVKELREWVDCNVEWDSDGCDGHVDYDASPVKLVQYIDMVERDYVRRDAVEGNPEWIANLKCSEWREKAHKLERECDDWKIKCETRELAYKQADAQRKIYSEQIDELFAERDEWKAKAEGFAEALEKLGCSVLENGTVFANDNLPAENDVRTDSSDANDANAAQDTREKLEEDVRKWCGMYAYQADMVWAWLNRQARITERELKAEIAKRDKGIDRLKRRRDELGQQVSAMTAETVAYKATTDRLVTSCDQLQNERDQLREKLSQAIGYAHEITRLVDLG